MFNIAVFPLKLGSWWRHQMETFSALLAICAGNSPVSGEFPAQRPVTRSFDVSFDLCLDKRLSKQSWGWWFETLSRSLCRHRNGWKHHPRGLVQNCSNPIANAQELLQSYINRWLTINLCNSKIPTWFWLLADLHNNITQGNITAGNVNWCQVNFHLENTISCFLWNCNNTWTIPHVWDSGTLLLQN